MDFLMVLKYIKVSYHCRGYQYLGFPSLTFRFPRPFCSFMGLITPPCIIESEKQMRSHAFGSREVVISKFPRNFHDL